MSAVSLPLSVAGAAAATTAAPMVEAAVPEGAAVAAPAPAIDSAGVDLPASSIDPDNAATTAEAMRTTGTVADAAPVTAAEAFAARGQATGVASPAPIATTTAHAGVAPPAPPSATSAGSLGGALFALVLVVGLILLLSWLAKRVPGLGGGGVANPALRIVGSLALGPRDRLVVVEVGETQLLLGVGAGGTRTLHTLEQPLPTTAAKSTPAFAQLLAQHFGKKP